MPGPCVLQQGSGVPTGPFPAASTAPRSWLSSQLCRSGDTPVAPRGHNTGINWNRRFIPWPGAAAAWQGTEHQRSRDTVSGPPPSTMKTVFLNVPLDLPSHYLSLPPFVVFQHRQDKAAVPSPCPHTHGYKRPLLRARVLPNAAGSRVPTVLCLLGLTGLVLNSNFVTASLLGITDRLFFMSS